MFCHPTSNLTDRGASNVYQWLSHRSSTINWLGHFAHPSLILQGGGELKTEKCTIWPWFSTTIARESLLFWNDRCFEFCNPKSNTKSERAWLFCHAQVLQFGPLISETIGLIGTHWGSMRLIGAHWGSLGLTGAHWGSLRLNGAHWGSLGLINWDPLKKKLKNPVESSMTQPLTHCSIF